MPLRDPAATWHSAWLGHILNADGETKRLLLTDMLRDICVDPNLPRPIVETDEPATLSIEGQSPPTLDGAGDDAH